jgi:SAM-dependent methyltransferase
MSWKDALRNSVVQARGHGIGWAFRVAVSQVFGRQSPYFDAHTLMFTGRGLELGGPSPLFGPRGYLPVYRHAGSLDNVNYARLTRWEGEITEGNTFSFRDGAAHGIQLVHEATSLSSISADQYDFVISSHMLEHTANPIKALLEWKRVLRPGGALLLVLPHLEGTFDHLRAATSLEHMESDYERDVGEDDQTHFEEIISLHDLKRDSHIGSRDALRKWIEANGINRGAHHHVFNTLTAAQLVARAGFQILCVEPALPDNICVFARKCDAGEYPVNAEFTSVLSKHLSQSPFRVDRSLGTPAAL